MKNRDKQNIEKIIHQVDAMEVLFDMLKRDYPQFKLTECDFENFQIDMIQISERLRRVNQ